MSPNLILWIVIGVAALILDMLTSAFLFVWFTIGAICAIITSAFGYNTVIQFIVFIIISIILIIICYPIIKRNSKDKIKPTLPREETYEGKKIIIDEEMEKNKAVKIDGVLWQLDSKNMALKKGDIVKITGMDGNKVIVEKIKGR